MPTKDLRLVIKTVVGGKRHRESAATNWVVSHKKKGSGVDAIGEVSEGMQAVAEAAKERGGKRRWERGLTRMMMSIIQSKVKPNYRIRKRVTLPMKGYLDVLHSTLVNDRRKPAATLMIPY